LKYYFRYVARLPEETVSASLVFGAAMHRAIEHHFRQLLSGAPAPSFADLFDVYQTRWHEPTGGEVRYAATESRQSLNAAAERLLKAFQTSRVAQPGGTILGVEEDLCGQIEPGAPMLRGIVDLIVETPDQLVLTDWKTSRARWSEYQVEDAAEQLLLYAELARDFAPRKPVHIELVILTKTKVAAIDRHPLPVDDRRLARTRRLVGRVWRAIQAEHFYPAPSPLTCGGCPFREPCRQWPD
jgi:putative RecB family exonuclease